MARTDLAKLYNWTDNRPSPGSQDFQNVMRWLADHGAPAPSVVEIALDPTGWVFPGSGQFPGSIIMLNFPGDPLPHDAAQVLNSPGVLLKELGLSPGGDLNYTPPGDPIPEPPKPTSHIGQALGGGWYTQVDPDTDTVVDGDKVIGLDGKTYQFKKGLIGGWYKLL